MYYIIIFMSIFLKPRNSKGDQFTNVSEKKCNKHLQTYSIIKLLSLPFDFRYFEI